MALARASAHTTVPGGTTLRNITSVATYLRINGCHVAYLPGQPHISAKRPFPARTLGERLRLCLLQPCACETLRDVVERCYIRWFGRLRTDTARTQKPALYDAWRDICALFHEPSATTRTAGGASTCPAGGQLRAPGARAGVRRLSAYLSAESRRGRLNGRHARTVR